MKQLSIVPQEVFPIPTEEVKEKPEVKLQSKPEVKSELKIEIIPKEQINMTLEEQLIKALEDNDSARFNVILENRALFNSIFTENNYNLTMLVLDHGSEDMFNSYLELMKKLKKKIKFTQKNTVIYFI